CRGTASCRGIGVGSGFYKMARAALVREPVHRGPIQGSRALVLRGRRVGGYSAGIAMGPLLIAGGIPAHPPLPSARWGGGKGGSVALLILTTVCREGAARRVREFEVVDQAGAAEAGGDKGDAVAVAGIVHRIGFDEQRRADHGVVDFEAG